jgi:hypothetical protein
MTMAAAVLRFISPCGKSTAFCGTVVLKPEVQFCLLLRFGFYDFFAREV